jgi:hypothetical protein
MLAMKTVKAARQKFSTQRGRPSFKELEQEF